MIVTLSITYENEIIANSIFISVFTDNKNELSIKSTLQNNILIFELNHKNIGSLKNSLDDLLENIGVSEKIVRLE